MIEENKSSPLVFEHTIIEAVTLPLAERDFQRQPPIQVHQNELVIFERKRKGIREEIWFSRRSYNVEDMATSIEDDEVDTMKQNIQGKYWLSRHLLSVNLVFDFQNGQLLPKGQLGWRDSKEDWWYFNNEGDLRRVLSEAVLPLILSVGLQSFDDSQEDMQEGKGNLATA